MSDSQDKDETSSAFAKSEVEATSPAESEAKDEAKTESLAPVGGQDEDAAKIIARSMAHQASPLGALIASAKKNADDQREVERLAQFEAKIDKMRERPPNYRDPEALVAIANEKTEYLIESLLESISEHCDDDPTLAFSAVDSEEEAEALIVAIQEIALKNLKDAVFTVLLEYAAKVDDLVFNFNEAQIADIIKVATSQIPDPREILASIKAKAKSQKDWIN
jgi:hypothetical protein